MVSSTMTNHVLCDWLCSVWGYKDEADWGPSFGDLERAGEYKRQSWQQCEKWKWTENKWEESVILQPERVRTWTKQVSMGRKRGWGSGTEAQIEPVWPAQWLNRNGERDGVKAGCPLVIIFSLGDWKVWLS